jgi:hypothetical protein
MPRATSRHVSSLVVRKSGFQLRACRDVVLADIIICSRQVLYSFQLNSIKKSTTIMLHPLCPVDHPESWVVLSHRQHASS